MSNALLDAALAYGRRGWYVFPVFEPVGFWCACGDPKCEHPAKHPRTARGLLDATTNETQIRKWWQRWPNANIGIACGPSGLIVLDVDPRHDGDESLRRLVADYGELDTLVALSGSGEHHYFQDSIATASRSNVFATHPGIDVRAKGGYVIAPPSKHVSGRSYEWELSSPEEPAPLPTWLAKLLTAREREPIVGGDDDQPIAEGARNDTLTRLAGRFRRQGMTAQAIEDALLATNRRQCVPALPEREIRIIARSIGRYAPAQNGVAYVQQAGEATADADAPEWGDPYPWPTLDRAALYGLAGEIVEAIAPNTEAAPVAMLLTLLTAFGNAAGAESRAMVGDDQSREASAARERVVHCPARIARGRPRVARGPSR